MERFHLQINRPIDPFLTFGGGWWCGVVCNAFRMKRSYSMPGPVSTAMGNCLRAGKPSRCKACQL